MTARPSRARPGTAAETEQDQKSRGAGLRAVLAALGANLGIAVVKLVAFAITGSASMLAESVHSLADSGNQALLLLGRSRAQREQTEEHPFGFGRERYFYAFVVAVVLFTVGAVFSVYEGIHKIIKPGAHQLAGGGVRGAGHRDGPGELLAAHRGAREQRGARAEQLDRVHPPGQGAGTARHPAGGHGRADRPGVRDGRGGADRDHRRRGLGRGGSLAIGVLLGCVAAVLAVEMKSLLIGESASAETERAIVTALEAGPEVQWVIHLRTLHMGPESLLVAAKIAISGADSAALVAAGIDAAERRVRQAVPIAEMIYLEPDIYRPGRADSTDPAIRAASAARPGPPAPHERHIHAVRTTP